MPDIDTRMKKSGDKTDLKRRAFGDSRRSADSMPRKAAISLRVDNDVLEWFKSRGRGYQTRINSVLRAFRDASL